MEYKEKIALILLEVIIIQIFQITNLIINFFFSNPNSSIQLLYWSNYPMIEL